MDFYCDEILAGRTPVQRVIETDIVLSFHHTQPFWPVHIVIIPTKRLGSLTELSNASAPVVSEMLSVAADICRRVVAEHGGPRLSANCGNYQSTPHLHFYVHHGERLRDEKGNAILSHPP